MVSNLSRKIVFLTHVVLLSAGQGRRLSPLTDEKPKCLLSISGKTLLEWQLQAIEACHLETGKIDGVTIVTGFEAQSVEAAVKVMPITLPVHCVYNPFFAVADNIGSCWSVRDILSGEAILINGDTLFDYRILMKLMNKENSSIAVTVDYKAHYDDDDMKVKIENGQLKRIGKKLTGKIDGESIGMLRFQKDGGDIFVGEMESLLHDPASLKLWYLSIIDRLAAKNTVDVMAIDGLPWQEVDFPHDVTAASERISQFDWCNAHGRKDAHVLTTGTRYQEG